MANALAIFKGGVNVHDAPLLSSPSKFMTSVPDAAALIGLSSVPDTQGYRWLHIQFDDGRGDGYVREDVTYVVGDISLWGGGKLADPAMARVAIPGASNVNNLHTAPTGANTAQVPPAVAPQAPPANGSASGRWNSPCPGVPVYLRYGANEGMDSAGKPVIHVGTDLSKASVLGLPIHMYGTGEVWQINPCSACPDERGGKHNGSVGEKNIGLNNANVLDDPAWTFGFGNETIFHYRYDQLPTSAQAAMRATKWNEQGDTFEGAHAYIVIAHQDRYADGLKVGPFAAGDAGMIVGYIGQSGNASGPHVHVEVRLHTSANPASLWDKVARTVDPTAMFAL